MNREEFINKIDLYISSGIAKDREKSFREEIKNDIENWVEFETNRAIAIKVQNDEKEAIASRFRKKYAPNKAASAGPKVVTMFSKQEDHSLIELMKAAFMNSNAPHDLNNLKELLANKDLDWEMILEFLKGESEE